MRLREIMSTRVETISPRESAQAALGRMRRARIRHLVVVDGQRIVGVLSERDIAALGSLRQVETVEDVMSGPAVTCSPSTTLRQAANLLRGRTIGCLPLVEEGKTVGIVTTTDLLDLIGAGIERPVPKTHRWVMKDRGPLRKPVAGRGRTVRLPTPG
jgi:acetoin utilization protein AcuB